LYQPPGLHLTLSQVVELNRRFLHGYSVFKDEPRLQALLRNVLKYNRHLQDLGLWDHQVSLTTRFRLDLGLIPTKGAKSPKGKLEDAWLVVIPCWVVEHLEHFRFAWCDLERTDLLNCFYLIKKES
jgi:hypothetical protein